MVYSHQSIKQVLLTGPDRAPRALTGYPLTQAGYVVREGEGCPSLPNTCAAVVVCPEASDASGLLALSELLADGELAEHTAYLNTQSSLTLEGEVVC